MVSAVKKNDMFLWGLIALLLISVVGGNYYFMSVTLLLRVVVAVFALCFASFIAFKTNVGVKFLVFWRDSLVELRKMVWPNRKEIMQTTFAVLAVVVFVGVFLWTVDAILVRAVAWMLGHGGV